MKYSDKNTNRSNFEVTVDALRQKNLREGRFRKAGYNISADRLAQCEPRRPCKSGSCPACQSVWVEKHAPAVRRALCGGTGCARVIWNPPEMNIQIGKLGRFDSSSFLRDRAHIIYKAFPRGTSCIAGCLLQLNDFSEGLPTWNPYIYAILACPVNDEINRRIRNQCRIGKYSTSVLRCDTIDNDELSLYVDYLLKNRAYRLSEGKDGRLGRCLVTREYDVEFARYRHRLGLGRDILIRNMKKYAVVGD